MAQAKVPESCIRKWSITILSFCHLIIPTSKTPEATGSLGSRVQNRAKPSAADMGKLKSYSQVSEGARGHRTEGKEQGPWRQVVSTVARNLVWFWGV